MILEHRHRPGLQRFRHQRVVGVGEDARGHAPRIVPGQLMDIHQQAHHLGDRDGRMRVVQLHRNLVRQLRPARVILLVAEQYVLQRSADEEILLLQTQLAPHLGGVIRVQHLGQVLRFILVGDRLDVVALIEIAQSRNRARISPPTAACC